MQFKDFKELQQNRNKMKVDIEIALKDLLDKYPELHNQTVAFCENNIKIAKEETSMCMQKEAVPGVLFGISPKIEVKKSTVHGYGVFAKEQIAEGDLLEEAVLLELGGRGKLDKLDTVLQNYVWTNKKCKCRDCEIYGFKNYLGLGFISIYNHSDQPNTIQKINYAQRVVNIWAERTIEKGQEIFINYGGQYWIVRDFWAHVNKTGTIAQYHKANVEPLIK
jgi:hypothetical protein